MKSPRPVSTLLHLSFLLSFLTPGLMAAEATPAEILTRVEDTLRDEKPRGTDTLAALAKKWQPDGSFSDFDFRKGTAKSMGRTYFLHVERLLVIGKALFLTASVSNAEAAALKEAGIRSFTFLADEAPGTAGLNPIFSYGSMHVPAVMAETLVVWRKVLPPDLIRRLHEKYFVAPGCWKGFTGPEFYGMNMTERGTAAFLMGILLGDRELTRDAVDRVTREILAFDRDGVCADGSFHQHDLNWSFAGEKNGPPGYHLYSGGYGIAYGVQVCQFLTWTKGTEWDLGEPSRKQLMHFVLSHLQWLSYPPHVWEISSLGRSLGAGYSSFGNGETLAQLAKDLIPLGGETAALQAIADRYAKGVTAANRLSGTRVYWNSDLAVTWSGPLFAALRMISYRTGRPETWLGENSKGIHLGDGFLTLALGGDEYGSTVKGQVFPLWDWQRLPGVTAVHTGVVPPSQTGRNDKAGSMGVRHFVGGVTDGVRGLCVMDFERPGSPVTAKKATLFTGHSVVCIGAGVQAGDGGDFPVETTAQQATRKSPVEWRDAQGKAVSFTNGRGELPSLAKAVCSGFGFRFLDPRQVVACEAGPRKGDWRDIGQASGTATGEMYWLGIDHGKNPRAAKYAFEISACDNLAELEQRPVGARILVNDEEKVAFVEDGVFAAIGFYEKGTVNLPGFGAVESEDPLLLLITPKQDGTWVLAVSDPTQSLRKIRLRFARRLEGPGATWDGGRKTTEIDLVLPFGTTASPAADDGEVGPRYSPRSMAGSTALRTFRVTGP